MFGVGPAASGETARGYPLGRARVGSEGNLFGAAPRGSILGNQRESGKWLKVGLGKSDLEGCLRMGPKDTGKGGPKSGLGGLRVGRAFQGGQEGT